MQDASHLTDQALLAEVVRLAGNERRATVALIVHLGELDARRLYEGEGFSSTFRYCMDALGLSEDAASNRIEAARVARRFPAVLEMLEAGTLSPTTARMLAKRLTPENHRELLAAAARKSKQEVERLLACRFPEAEPRAMIRPLGPAPTHAPTTSPVLAMDAPSAAIAGPATTAVDRPAASATPRPPERYEIRFTADAQTHANLRRAQDLLGHAVRGSDLGGVFARALTLLVADLEKKKLAATGQPRPAREATPGSRAIPAAVRRAVWARDGGRCAFVATGGRRCGETRALQFHHVRPFAAGGGTTVENVQLRCPPHNRHEARVYFGPIWNAREAPHPVSTRSGTGGGVPLNHRPT
jgi:hypothetical protein